MRRGVAAFVVAALSLGLVVVASPGAHASIPGPVDEIPDVPSRTDLLRSATGSPMGDEMLSNIWRAMMGKNATGTVVLPDVPEVAPKPITNPAAFTRGVGATAGSAIVTGAFLGGWAVGKGGLYLYGATTGTDFDGAMCNVAGGSQEGEWLVGIHTALNFGLGPTCAGYNPETANADQAIDRSLTYSGQTYAMEAGIGSFGYRCFYRRSSIPAFTAVRVNEVGAVGGWTALAAAASNSNCGAFTPPAGFGEGWASVSSNYVLQLITQTGHAQGADQVLASSSMTRPDPLRTPRCRMTASDGEVKTATGTPYRESQGLPQSAAGLGCKQVYEDFVSAPGRGPGFIPDRIQVESQQEGGSITQISDQEVPDMSPDQRKAFETGNGRGLVLEKVTGVTVRSCMTWEADCSGWWTATSSGTAPTVGTSTYRCTYAGSEIALTECGVYRNTFDSQTSTPTITDPATGTEQGWSAQPNTGNSLDPSVGPGTGASPADACFSTGWASVANPVDWVLVPIKCALVWAFVPRQSVVDSARANIEGTVEDSVVGSVGASLAVLGGAFDAGVGCGGLPIHLEAFGHTLVDSYLLASCEEPAAGIAATVRTILSVAIIGGGIMAFTRYLGSLFGFESFGRNRTEKTGGPSFD